MQNKTHLSKLGFVLTLVAFSLCFILGASTPALAGTQKAGSSNIKTTEEKTVSHQFTVQEQQAALAYWTPERMKSATDAEMLVKAPAQNEPQPQVSKGPAHTGSPFVPQGAKLQAPGQGLHPDAGQLPHSSYSSFPFSTIGKVFFTQDGGNWVCSGTVVNSFNKSVVDTAGHCVIAGASGNHWSSNFVFCPQYYYGSSPYGCWTAHFLATVTYWSYYGWRGYDYGAAAVSANGYGNVVNVVGGTGYAYNYSNNQLFHALGYPQASPFDGNTMWGCVSGLVGIDSPNPGPSTSAIICNMTKGCSGGGWLISINNKLGYVNGHNDYRYNDPNILYSPYYGSDWFNYVYNPAQNA